MSARAIFEALPSRVDASKLEGIENSFLFEIEGEGDWLVTAHDGKLTVTEGKGPADVTVKTTSEVFDKLVSGEQNPALAYMSGKVKIEGDIGVALKLQKLF